MKFTLSDFDFDFDPTRIALRPLTPRGAARALIWEQGQITHKHVRDYVDCFDSRDLLVFNNTRVLPARLDGVRTRLDASARISVTLLESHSSTLWRAMIKPQKKVELGEVITFGPDLSATLVEKMDGIVLLEFSGDFSQGLARYGRMPLPPYIESKRPADAQDHADYQPLMARIEGAVAAPTASLHFDQTLLEALAAKNVRFETLTLHVGAGTFLPVKTEDLSQHKMHAERGIIPQDVADRLNAHKQNGGRIVAIGTTVLRLIEAATVSGSVEAYDGLTDIFITPGYDFQIVDGLVTNFHLPKSTLLMLVSAFVGYDAMHEIYQEAVAHHYRFFSYGDSSLLWRP